MGLHLSCINCVIFFFSPCNKWLNKERLIRERDSDGVFHKQPCKLNPFSKEAGVQVSHRNYILQKQIKLGFFCLKTQSSHITLVSIWPFYNLHTKKQNPKKPHKKPTQQLQLPSIQRLTDNSGFGEHSNQNRDMNFFSYETLFLDYISRSYLQEKTASPHLQGQT